MLKTIVAGVLVAAAWVAPGHATVYEFSFSGSLGSATGTYSTDDVAFSVPGAVEYNASGQFVLNGQTFVSDLGRVRIYTDYNQSGEIFNGFTIGLTYDNQRYAIAALDYSSPASTFRGMQSSFATVFSSAPDVTYAITPVLAAPGPVAGGSLASLVGLAIAFGLRRLRPSSGA